MSWRVEFRFLRRHGRLLAVTALVLCAGVLLFTSVELTDTGDHEGIYILRGKTKRWEVKDDLFLGDEGRLVFRISFESLFDFFRAVKLGKLSPPYLTFEWNRKGGRGFVISHLPQGSKLITCFGRFTDDRGRMPSGLFVGGGLPDWEGGVAHLVLNETGMAYFSGQRWLHIWCNVNEFFATASRPELSIPPRDWRFLGSQVLRGDPQRLVIRSSHVVDLEGVPLRVDKHAFFRAGDAYFILSTRVTNEGDRPAGYFYSYGDEPWVGNYGNSLGDVGWTQQGIVPYEGAVDPGSTTFIGMADIGNPFARDTGPFTGASNFLEWLGGVTPQMAYFSNKVGPLRRPEDHVPLHVRASRSLYLQWGPRNLAPGESELYLLAVGMGRPNPIPGGAPVKPLTELDPSWRRYIDSVPFTRPLPPPPRSR